MLRVAFHATIFCHENIPMEACPQLATVPNLQVVAGDAPTGNRNSPGEDGHFGVWTLRPHTPLKSHLETLPSPEIFQS